MRDVFKAIILGSCIIPFSVLATTPQIQNVTAVMSPYPWSNACSITYTVVGDIAAVYPKAGITLYITATDKVTGAAYVADASALSGDTGTEEGEHHVIWDLGKQGVTLNSNQVVFSVAYERPWRYCVIHLGIDADPNILLSSYRISYLDDVPSGGWTDAYKTTRLVLRCIEPGSIPTHDARITKPFYIGVFEVTQKQYEIVMRSNPSTSDIGKGNTYPVHHVSYNDVSSFMSTLCKRTGISGFGLPTEAQWEYACRAGTSTTYSYGNSADSDYMWYVSNSFASRHPVGTTKPNAWGLYDMHGNVWEWCADWYADSGVLYGDDPVCPSWSNKGRVLRGGSASVGAGYCTSSSRWSSYPENADYVYSSHTDGYGFRLVRTLSE